MLGRTGSVLDLAAHCNQHVSRGGGRDGPRPSSYSRATRRPGLVTRPGPRTRSTRPFLPGLRKKGSQEGSRCNTGAAPATVTGDKVRQIHWAKSLGRAERRTIRQARRPTVLAPALPILGSSVRLAIPRGAEARRHGPQCAPPCRFIFGPRRSRIRHLGGIRLFGREARNRGAVQAWQSSTY